MTEHCCFCNLDFTTFDELVQHNTDCHGYTHNHYFFYKGQKEMQEKAALNKVSLPQNTFHESRLIQKDLLL